MFQLRVISYLAVANIVVSLTSPKPNPYTKTDIINALSFADLVQHGTYVDKSLFLRDLFVYPYDVVAISRPRKLGKSIILTMLYEFLSNKGNSALFNGLDIMKTEHEALRKEHMNQHPVIFISYLGVGKTSMAATMRSVLSKIRTVFTQFDYVRNATNVTAGKYTFDAIISGTATVEQYMTSISMLSIMLTQYHGKKPIILIDEADALLVDSLMGDYFNDMHRSLSRFFMHTLKLNTFYTKAVVCGVLPVFRMDSFSMPDNFKVLTITSKEFRTSFGFTKTEVEKLMLNFTIRPDTMIKNLTDWYNNCKIGGEAIYTPGSVLECLKSGGEFKKTSDAISGSVPSLAEHILKMRGLLPVFSFQALISGNSLNRTLPAMFDFRYVLTQENAMWNFFYHAGVVVQDNILCDNGKKRPSIRITGKELQLLIKEYLVERISIVHGLPSYEEFKKQIFEENTGYVNHEIQRYISNAGVYLWGRPNRMRTTMSTLARYMKTIFIPYKRLYGVDIHTVTRPRILRVIIYLQNKTTGFPDCERLRRRRAMVTDVAVESGGFVYLSKEKKEYYLDKEWIQMGSQFFKIVTAVEVFCGDGHKIG